MSGCFLSPALLIGWIARRFLIVTEEVSPQSPFRASVELRWEGDKPLKVSTWALKEGESTLGDIQVFDEQGKEVQMMFPISMPLMPDGERVIKKGEVVKFGLYLMGWPFFERGGSYYAIATFSSAWSGGVNVRFTTKKRWFKVAEPAEKRLNRDRPARIAADQPPSH